MEILKRISTFEEKMKSLPLSGKPYANNENWRFSPDQLWQELNALQLEDASPSFKRTPHLVSLEMLEKPLLQRIIDLVEQHPWSSSLPFLQRMDAQLSQSCVIIIQGDKSLDEPITLELDEHLIDVLEKPLFVVFDKESKGRVILNSKGTHPFLANLRVIGLENSSVHLDIFEKTQGTWALFEQVILLDNAELKHSFLSLGTGAKRRDTTLLLKGQQARCYARSAYFSRFKDHKEMFVRQQHIGQHSESYVLEKGVVSDKAYNVLNGLIQVFPNASFSQAYLTNNNLHLKDGARSHSIPRLEIQENEVKCSHSSTACLLDSNHLFYMCARGITDREAREILTKSFLEEALQEAHENLVEELACLSF